MAYHNPVRITRVRSGTTACCRDCGRLPLDSTRERVRQHVRETGHRATVTVSEITRYEPKDTPS